MSINPLGDGSHLPFSNETKEKEVGSLGEHAVSNNSEDKKNIKEESIKQLASNMGNESEKTGQSKHHLVEVNQQGDSPKHVLGPNGDLYSVITKEDKEGIQEARELFLRVNEELKERFANSKYGPNNLELLEVAGEGFGETVSSVSSFLSEVRETIENTPEETEVNVNESCCKKLTDFLKEVLFGIRQLYMSFFNKASSMFKSRVEEEVKGLEEEIKGLEESINKANLSDKKAENILNRLWIHVKSGIKSFLDFFRLLFDKTQTRGKEKSSLENPYGNVSVRKRSSSLPTQNTSELQETFLQELKDKLKQRSQSDSNLNIYW